MDKKIAIITAMAVIISFLSGAVAMQFILPKIELVKNALQYNMTPALNNDSTAHRKLKNRAKIPLILLKFKKHLTTVYRVCSYRSNKST
ncbi:hypothetical protein [Methanobacterium oryzae]|uniref:hypothetical protein n=1 Tax=Methanobacterium oryzae TaxID=69540 RepID=UPI003D1CBE8A